MSDPVDGERNRELGLTLTAAILSRLYEAWPKRINLDISDLDVWPTHDDETEMFNAIFREAAVWDGLIGWLEDEGIIRVKSRHLRGDSAIGVILTGKGFVLLQVSVPGEPQKSFGRRLGELSKEVGRAGLNEGAKALAKSGAGEIAQILGRFFGGAAHASVTIAV